MPTPLTPDLAELKRLYKEQPFHELFVAGPHPAVTICVSLSPAHWNPACPESYEPEHVEPVVELWPSDAGEAPATVKTFAAHIVAAHNDFPALLAAVEERDRLAKRVYSLERKLYAAELRLAMREDVAKLQGTLTKGNR